MKLEDLRFHHSFISAVFPNLESFSHMTNVGEVGWWWWWGGKLYDISALTEIRLYLSVFNFLLPEKPRQTTSEVHVRSVMKEQGIKGGQ